MPWRRNAFGRDLRSHTSADGDEALRLAFELRPSFAYLDVHLAERIGSRTRRAIGSADGSDPIPVLILTIFDIDKYVFGAIEAGAAGCLLQGA